MDLIELIKTRRSIRAFKEEDISDELLESIIAAAMTAPSAGNQQPWQFIVVRNREKLAAIPAFHPYCRMAAQAPLAVVVCGDPDGKKWPDYWVQDCSAAVQNLLLAARAVGVGSVWTGVYPLEERMAGCRQLFSIPAHIIPFAIIPMGWPRDESDFREADRHRSELIHQERFQG
ncbi:MAG: nitroreductase family protein [Desulfocapsaceae bacterium]|nr:nitroreductase family protein [Desulfocapsaceae bacterium]